MSFKNLFIIFCTVILTIFLTVNRDAVEFDFLIGDPVPVSKLLVIGICILIGFILGYIAGRPKRVIASLDNELDHNPNQSNSNPQSPSNELSEEDRNYIS